MGLQPLGTLLVAAKLLRCAGLRLLWLRSPLWILRRMAPRLAALVNRHLAGGGVTSPPLFRSASTPGWLNRILRLNFPYLCPQEIAVQSRSWK
jgi:hypothetical protein